MVISPDARISKFADIDHPVSGTRIDVGPGPGVNSFVKINPAGGSGAVIIHGEGCYIHSGTIYSGNGVRLGCGVVVSANCTLVPMNHIFRDRNCPSREQGLLPNRRRNLNEDDAWIGAKTMNLDGAVLCQDCVLDANLLVVAEVAAHPFQSGKPFRQVGDRV